MQRQRQDDHAAYPDGLIDRVLGVVLPDLELDQGERCI